MTANPLPRCSRGQRKTTALLQQLHPLLGRDERRRVPGGRPGERPVGDVRTLAREDVAGLRGSVEQGVAMRIGTSFRGDVEAWVAHLRQIEDLGFGVVGMGDS
jgi:hypothetical protein